MGTMDQGSVAEAAFFRVSGATARENCTIFSFFGRRGDKKRQVLLGKAGKRASSEPYFILWA